MSHQDRHIRRSGDDYAAALTKLLPRGAAWPREQERLIMRVVRGLAQIWGYVDGRAADLLEKESDPRKTVELLPDWERAFGLPDPCFSEPFSIEARQAMLLFKMTLKGAQSRDFFVRMMKMVGHDISIREWSPFMAGVSRVGDTRGEWGELFPPDMGRIPASGDPMGGALSWPSLGITTSSPVFGAPVIKQAHAFQAVNLEVRSPWIGPDTVLAINQLANKNARPLITLPPVFGSPTLISPVSGSLTVGSPEFGRPALVETDLGPQLETFDYRWEIGPPEMRFSWAVRVGAARISWFRAASGQCGIDPHMRLGLASDLECLLNRWKPAQTELVFDYTFLRYGDPMQGTP